MAQENFQRMLQLIDTVFATRSDPNQLQVNQKAMKKLEKIHPATLSELADENGLGIWVLLIPTTKKVMEDFLNATISEKDILNNTQPGQQYECIYLCSATTLPEYRGKGETKKLCMQAITAICKDYPIQTLYVWPFTEAGENLAETIANHCGLSLLKVKSTD
jgi:hypothetical protein